MTVVVVVVAHIPEKLTSMNVSLVTKQGGNTKTVMCANCGPAGYNYDETVSFYIGVYNITLHKDG